MIIQYSF